MTTIIQSLVGKKLLDAAPIEQGARMLFDDGTILVSFNKTSVVSDHTVAYDDLHDRVVEMINEEIDSIRIYFDALTSVLISLREEECTGPEFLELILPTGRRVVWN